MFIIALFTIVKKWKNNPLMCMNSKWTNELWQIHTTMENNIDTCNNMDES